jgi:L-threonate 2-dehydrogenase
MALRIGIPAAGEMGAGVGRVLSAAGARVLTVPEGRSPRTQARAEAAGMEAADFPALAGADLILSITPPGVALETARALAPHVRKDAPPLYLDLNAVSPQLTREVGGVVEAAGAAFLDGGIIGAPPAPGRGGPRIYVSGPRPERALVLRELGLDIRLLDGGVGAASALKMCYGGFTKGITGLSAALILAAEREGVGASLHAEMSASQPALIRRAESALPDMYPKAYRWVAEMEEIARFIGDERGESGVWAGLARLYDRLAADLEAGGEEIAVANAFLARRSDGGVPG